MFQRLATFICFIAPTLVFAHGGQIESDSVWISVHTPSKIERTRLANEGVAIDNVVDDTSYAFVAPTEVKRLRDLGFTIDKSLPASAFKRDERDFPSQDGVFHNYAELTSALQGMASTYSRFLTLFSIGKTLEGRDIWALRFSSEGLEAKEPGSLPGIVFVGGHHAREHLSVEMPLKLARYLAENNGPDPVVTELLRTREVFIIPQLNVDGSEFDISGGTYKMWRKNRRVPTSGNCAGTDLNRNYGYMWGTGGSSTNPCNDTYMGPTPFSEPETQVMKAFIEARPNLKILLSFHTYSELILYPWGHKYDPVENAQDRATYETMARTMAGWNGYTPQQASDLYIASGDTTDWTYGSLGIISFTFELSPSSSQWGGGGFYPGAGAIEPTFRANLRPALYLIDLADNPHRSVQSPQTTLFYGQ